MDRKTCGRKARLIRSYLVHEETLTQAHGAAERQSAAPFEAAGKKVMKSQAHGEAEKTMASRSAVTIERAMVVRALRRQHEKRENAVVPSAGNARSALSNAGRKRSPADYTA